jgi:hypothetical protein
MLAVTIKKFSYLLIEKVLYHSENGFSISRERYGLPAIRMDIRLSRSSHEIIGMRMNLSYRIVMTLFFVDVAVRDLSSLQANIIAYIHGLVPGTS